MIEFDNFCVLHMPRCGGSYIERLFALCEQKEPGHEGWSYFKPQKDVYGVIRDPASWYLSLHAYSNSKNLILKEIFGIHDNDTIDVALTKWITGSHMERGEIEIPQLKPYNIYQQMNNMQIGFWSWWVLHIYGVNGGLDRNEQLSEEVTLLWLRNRECDLSFLSKKYGCIFRDQPEENIEYAKNKSEKAPYEVFSPHLMSLLIEYDAPILARTLRLSSLL